MVFPKLALPTSGAPNVNTLEDRSFNRLAAPKVHFELSEFETVFDGILEGDTISGDFVDPDGTGPFSLKR